MSVFKNTQVAKQFKVSNTTVSNWIESSEKNQNDLQLTTLGKRKVIIDNLHNREVIKKLTQRGKKHLWGAKVIQTKALPEIYNIFSSNQLAEIVSSLTSSREIPYKFTYMDKGADLWGKHYLLSLEDAERVVVKERNLMKENVEYLLFRLKKFNKINIFDIGCGNGLPVIPIIGELKRMNKVVSYTALDISPRMAEIDKKELLREFPDLNYSKQIMDIDTSNFSDLLIESKSDSSCANLLLFLGGTLGNQTDLSRAYSNFRDSMGVNDYLLLGVGLETNQMKITAVQPHNQYHYDRTVWILDMLGLKGCYPETTLDMYNSQEHQFMRNIEIQKDISTQIEINSRQIVLDFKQGDEVCVARFRRFREEELVHQILSHDFGLDHYISSEDGSYALILVRRKRRVE
jgi:uncharacterized SAM-dependent methyltransferase